jgi:phospholipase/carboxylesterase
MSEAVVDDIVAVLPPLLQSLEALGFVARYLNPPDFDRVMERVGEPDEALRAERPRLEQWPEQFVAIKAPLEAASDAALAAFEALRVVQRGEGEFTSLFRGLRYASRAQEALYALTARLPPVNRFFIDPNCATTPISRPGWRRRRTPIPASFTTTTSPAAAAASRSTCRNTTRRTARGRW